jgi:hypothetical protein
MNTPNRHPGLVPESSALQANPHELPSASPAEPWTPAQGRGDGGKTVSVGFVIPTVALLALTACGSAAGLAPRAGETLPMAPRGARATPTPNELLTPTVQQRPQRGDELLKNSQERRSDEFDLPPSG